MGTPDNGGEQSKELWQGDITNGHSKIYKGSGDISAHQTPPITKYQLQGWTGPEKHIEVLTCKYLPQKKELPSSLAPLWPFVCPLRSLQGRKNIQSLGVKTHGHSLSLLGSHLWFIDLVPHNITHNESDFHIISQSAVYFHSLIKLHISHLSCLLFLLSDLCCVNPPNYI